MKTVLTILSLSLMLSLNAQIDLDNGLVAYYPFNDSGEDESPFGNDAVALNQIVFETAEINDVTQTVATFNGMNSFIQIPNANQINFDNESTFSISFWLKAPEQQVDLNGTVNDIFHKWNNTSQEPYPYTMRIYNQGNAQYRGAVRPALYQGNAPGCSEPAGVGATSVTRINDNEWHHIVFSRTNEGSLQLYIDCELEFEIDDTSTCTTESPSPLIFGMREPNGVFSRAFKGSLDEVRIHDRALTADELILLCSSPSSVGDELAGEENISLFPNPITRGDVLQFNTQEGVNVVDYLLYNSLGALVGVLKPQDVVEAPAGSYTVIVRLSNGGKVQKKLVVM